MIGKKIILLIISLGIALTEAAAQDTLAPLDISYSSKRLALPSQARPSSTFLRTAAARSKPFSLPKELEQKPDALRVQKPVLDHYSATVGYFSSKSLMLNAAVALAVYSGNEEEIDQKVLEAGAFYLEHAKNENIQIRLGSLKALTEMTANGYWNKQNRAHTALTGELKRFALQQLAGRKSCNGLNCQTLGMSAILYAALNPSSAQKGVSALRPLMKNDYGSEENNLTVAVYLFQAALILDGPRGVYSLLMAFDQSNRPSDAFRQYRSKNYRVYAEAADILAAAGPQASVYLKDMAFYQVPSLAAQIHAATELAYFPLSDSERKKLSALLTSLYCRNRNDYTAYTEPVYRSSVLPSSAPGNNLLARLAYAYGGGRAPEYIQSTSDPKQCLPIVPQRIPSDIQSQEFLKEHSLDIALIFVPIPGGYLTKVSSALAKTAFGQAVKTGGKAAGEQLGKIVFRLGGKRAGYTFMTRTLNYPPKQAMAKLYDMGARPYSSAARLRGDSYIINNLDDHMLKLDVSPIPSFPVPSHSKLMYRGMALNDEGIRAIRQEGLLISKVSGNNNDLLVGLAGGIHGRSAAHVASQRVICMTSKTSEAAQYSTVRMGAGKQIPSVLEITGQHHMKLLMSHKDIPPSQIRRISVLLNINGKPTWGLLETAENGAFVFRPYAP